MRFLCNSLLFLDESTKISKSRNQESGTPAELYTYISIFIKTWLSKEFLFFFSLFLVTVFLFVQRTHLFFSFLLFFLFFCQERLKYFDKILVDHWIYDFYFLLFFRTQLKAFQISRPFKVTKLIKTDEIYSQLQ